MRDLQRKAGEWHRQRFPNATKDHVAMKLTEEVGEVCRAINGEYNELSSTGYGEAPKEIGDVLIAAFVLIDRWYSEFDLTTVIEQKLATLMTPNAHRASIKDAISEPHLDAVIGNWIGDSHDEPR